MEEMALGNYGSMQIQYLLINLSKSINLNVPEVKESKSLEDFFLS
jgi:hypothetical protein